MSIHGSTVLAMPLTPRAVGHRIDDAAQSTARLPPGLVHVGVDLGSVEMANALATQLAVPEIRGDVSTVALPTCSAHSKRLDVIAR